MAGPRSDSPNSEIPAGGARTPLIGNESLESYLRCKTKGYLKIHEIRGIVSEYETLLAEKRTSLGQRAAEKLTARYQAEDVLQNVRVTDSVLKQGAPLILGATVGDEGVSVKLDGLKRVDESSCLGGFYYAPILFVEGEKIDQVQRRLLELCGPLIGDFQGKQPSYGFMVRGEGLRMSRIEFKATPRAVRGILKEIRDLAATDSPPKLILNEHCQICEFRERCHAEALKEDNLSLLRGIGAKEIKGYGRKGIFTITQLSHTFRPRRKGKRDVQRFHSRKHALSALAIRDKSIYVLGTPQLPACPASIFLDLEGKPDEGFVYLIGMVIVKEGEERRITLWADGRDEETLIFERFLDEIEPLGEFLIFCYGSYEKAFLNRMIKKTTRTELVDRALKALVNILSLIYSHFYFPSFSNGLKDIARCLGFEWSSEQASGIQSLVWRMKWEATRSEEWKQKLTTYNLDDCLALKKVTEFVHAVREWADSGSVKPSTGSDGPQVALVHEIDKLATDRKWGKTKFVHPEFNFINDCAYFDYQRQRVFVRTSKILRKRVKLKAGRRRNRKLRKSKDYLIVDTNCPFCGSSDVTVAGPGRAGINATRVKRAFDLRVTPGGLRRKVIQCRSPVHFCQRCGKGFIPEAYQNLDKHFHSLKSWAIFLHVGHQISFSTLSQLFEEFFDVNIADTEILMFKNLLARTYEPTYRMLLQRILAGQVVHGDETEVKLKTGRGYVWVFASLEEVVFMYKPTREGGFVKDLLSGFKGVLVSDFYAAYDAVECPQQKCLIHLMRDINQELLNNPFDEELLSITQPFGTLLQSIVQTVDQHGLRRKFLEKHDRQVSDFFGSVFAKPFSSDAAINLRDRLLKNREKLFTFIHYDGVPWNNNSAENAIKKFAYYREGTVGVLTEAGLNDYLILLSLFQSCRYRGVSFFKFLLSRELDLDAFCEGSRSKRKFPPIEVYPKGFVPPHLLRFRDLKSHEHRPPSDEVQS